MKILIVEDEVLTAMFLQDTVNELLGENTVSNVFDEYQTLFNYLVDNTIDLIFMDIKLSGEKDGIEIAYEVKKFYPSISIVFITAFKDSRTIQRAKDVAPLGYLIKPIIEHDIEAILMVADSFLSQKKEKTQYIHSLTPYTYNIMSKELYHKNIPISLTTNEAICLESLLENKNNYVKQEKLIKSIWIDETNRLASLRELVYRLRKKLSLLEIKNISKQGYMLKTLE